jgi:hypothetical protein
VYFEFNPEDGGDTFLRHVDNHVQYYSASQPATLHTVHVLDSVPQISVSKGIFIQVVLFEWHL